MPVRVQVTFSHAALQVVADQAGADVLHIKGVAVDPAFAPHRRAGTDADVLVRPAHLRILLDAMEAAGWERLSSFDSGSPFGHAATYAHPHWGHADVHRWFPGIGLDPAAAFDLLWSEWERRDLAGVACPVPSPAAHSTLLLLNAARGGGLNLRALDIEALWTHADQTRRDEILALVTELDAHVAFAAATGGLERFREAPDYDLWRIARDGGTRVAEWRARIKATPRWQDRVRLAARATLVNVDHLTVRLGHRPSPGEVFREFVARPLRGVTEQRRARQDRPSRHTGTGPE